MNYRKLIEDFTITCVYEIDGIITVFGKDDLLICEVSLDEVLEKCPHGYGYTSDMHSVHYRVETSRMWEERPARVGMVAAVFDSIPKKWMDQNYEEIIYPSNHSEMMWIRVKDRIPTEDKEYLTVTRFRHREREMHGSREWLAVGTSYLGSFHKNYNYSSDTVESAVVVLWMEMPEMPENMES